MVRQIKQAKTYRINPAAELIPETVERIKDARGVAYSTLSGRPISLCKSLERRGELRVRFEEPIYLWPVQYAGGLAISSQDQPIIAVTRDISEHGVGFGYDEDIPTDYLVAEFDLFGQGTELLLIEIRWSEKNAPHSYVAGGLIVGSVKEDHSTSESSTQ